MAADSACSDDWQFLTRAVKIVRLQSGGLFGSAGDADTRAVVELVTRIKSAAGLPTKKQIETLETDFSAILVLPKGSVYNIYLDYIDQGNGRWSGGLIPVDGFYAVGSGAVFAMAALRAGHSAKDAVAISCHSDFFTRMPVHSQTLAPPPKASKAKKK